MEEEPSTSKRSNIKIESRGKSHETKDVLNIRQKKQKTKLAWAGRKSLNKDWKKRYKSAVSWQGTLERISEKTVISDSADAVVSKDFESPERLRDAGYCFEEAGGDSPLIRFRKEQDLPLEEDLDETVVPLPLRNVPSLSLQNLVNSEDKEDHQLPARKNVVKMCLVSVRRLKGVSSQQKFAHRGLPSQTQVPESNILSASAGKRSLKKSAKLVRSFVKHREIQSIKKNEQSKTREPGGQRPRKPKSPELNVVRGWWQQPTDDPNDPYKISCVLADEMERDPRTGQRISYMEFRRRNNKKNKQQSKNIENDIRTSKMRFYDFRNEVITFETSEDESIEESPGSKPTNI